MSKQFLDVPVGVAKELIERVISDPSHNIPDYAGATVTYDTEVFLTINDIFSLPQTNTVIYFGSFFCADPTERNDLHIHDQVTSFISFAIPSGLTVPVLFDCVIFNFPINLSQGCYFYGYKFNLTY